MCKLISYTLVWSTMSSLLSTFKVGLLVAQALDVAFLLDIAVQSHTKPEQPQAFRPPYYTQESRFSQYASHL